MPNAATNDHSAFRTAVSADAEMGIPSPRTKKVLSRIMEMACHLAKNGIHFGSVLSMAIYCRTLIARPIQRNKIVFISQGGKQYSCNPKYISESLLSLYPGQFEIVWAFNDPSKFQYLKDQGIRVEKAGGKEHLKDLMTAGAIVTNVEFYSYLPDKPGRLALNTWHGGGAYKRVGFLYKPNLASKLHQRVLSANYSKPNLYLSSCREFTRQVLRESRHYTGEVMEVGMPRNDFLINGGRPDIAKKVRDAFGLDNSVRIALYAPTFRSKQELSQFPQLDANGVNRALHERFGGEWVCLFRCHHLGDTENAGMIQATDYPDIQELLYAADVLLSDYSSTIWDFSLMFKPVFLYCPDLNVYASERDFYTPIEQWPFILSTDQQELENNISSFDEARYISAVKAHHSALGSYETGTATQQVCRRLAAHCLG